MIIEIRQLGFLNKGSELMLRAVVSKLRARYPEAKITMAPIFGGADDTYEKMRDLGLYPKAWLWRYGINWARFAKFLPKKLLSMYGLIVDEDVDVVIDGAGFAYSDQWGVLSSKELARSSSVWKKKSTQLILLPQAFGPFKEREIKGYVTSWVNNSNLIFAREADSYNYLTDVVGEQDKIKLYPDFTNSIDGIIPLDYNNDGKRVALVPNFRMIDKTSPEESNAYLPFMIQCAKALVKRGAEPFILVHEGQQDMLLAKEIAFKSGGIPIVRETDPLHIKGILGTCDATVGSRFHGLVSALSQGVPSIATGWSHKYTRLFEDYDFSEGVVSVLDSEAEIEMKLDYLLDDETSQSLRLRLKKASDKLKKQSDEMWSIVFEEIELSRK